MSSLQRRRGQTAKVWRTEAGTDRRGNIVKAAVEYGPYEVRAAFIPQRGSKAEVPGQQIIRVVRMVLPVLPPDVELWSRVEYDGKLWDVVTPPEYHHGSRHVRHWSIDLRERP